MNCDCIGGSIQLVTTSVTGPNSTKTQCANTLLNVVISSYVTILRIATILLRMIRNRMHYRI